MLKNKFPILEFDPETPALIEPSQQIKPLEGMPEHCVICFFKEVIDILLAEGKLTEIACQKSEMGRHPVYRLDGSEKPIALFHPGIGAPCATSFLEEVIALGARKFIACGGAGTLEAAHTVGKLIVPVSAIRDEGTSYHYLPPGLESTPSKRALEAVQVTLHNAGVPFALTKTWTTDAIYRETKARIKQRREQGCGCVEMEAAAFFAVARFRNVEFAQILYAGDDLSGESWDSRNWDNKLDIRKNLFELAVRACISI